MNLAPDPPRVTRSDRRLIIIVLIIVCLTFAGLGIVFAQDSGTNAAARDARAGVEYQAARAERDLCVADITRRREIAKVRSSRAQDSLQLIVASRLLGRQVHPDRLTKVRHELRRVELHLAASEVEMQFQNHLCPFPAAPTEETP